MSSVRSTVSIDSIIGISMIGNYYCLIAVLLCCLNNIVNTSVNSNHSLLNSFVYSRVAHHISISKVHNDKVEFFAVNSLNQLISNRICAHLRLQIVCSHLWRRNQYTLFLIEWSLTTAIEEESNMSILLCFCNMKLSHIL